MTTAADRRWFEAVASVPCCVLCGTWGVQVSHSNRDRGMSQKSAAHQTAALCPRCHNDIDNGKELSQVERRAMHDRAITLTHDWLIRNGKLRLVP